MAVRIHYRGYFWSGSSHTEGNALQVPDDSSSLAATTLDELCVCVACILLGTMCNVFIYLCAFTRRSLVCVCVVREVELGDCHRSTAAAF